MHIATESRGKLADRFIIPPFSVLNAREGWWQERKKAWLALGIKGEETRKGTLRTSTVQEGAEYNGGSCWLGDTASVFDPVLCEVVYWWFCPKGGMVLDPFAGGAVRGIVAGLSGHRYWGSELRAEQVASNETQRDIANSSDVTWVVGDSADTLGGAPDADLIFTCPPYGDLEVYSSDPHDLSNMTHGIFTAAYKRIVQRACAKLKPNRFACVVVGDFRDKRTGNLRSFPETTIVAFREAGLELYNEAVLVTSCGSLPIRIGKQFVAGRKVGRTHQTVLVFVKGDGAAATKAIET